MASYYLREKLTIFDWIAVLIAFIGIVIMQSPFRQVEDVDPWNDIIGSAFAIFGAMFVGIATISIRLMTHYS